MKEKIKRKIDDQAQYKLKGFFIGILSSKHLVLLSTFFSSQQSAQWDRTISLGQLSYY